MVFLKSIERYFGVFLSIGVLGGFLFPSYFQNLDSYVVYVVMAIMGLLFLKVDVVDVLTHIRNPFFMLYINVINLIILPLATYFILKPFVSTELLLGLLLLASLPTGVSSAAFTDIMKGRTSLTLTIVLTSNLLATVTIPLVFWIAAKTDIQLDHWALFISLAKIIFVPFVIAKVCKRIIFPKIAMQLQDYYNTIILVLLSFMMMITISTQADYITQNFSDLLRELGILFAIFFVFQFVGYFSAFWHKKGEKLAVSNGSMIMNNILGIVLALAFFDSSVVNLLILSFIPWSSMIMLKHWYKKYLP